MGENDGKTNKGDNTQTIKTHAHAGQVRAGDPDFEEPFLDRRRRPRLPPRGVFAFVRFPLLLDCRERCPPRQKSRVERLRAKVEPLLIEVTV